MLLRRCLGLLSTSHACPGGCTTPGDVHACFFMTNTIEARERDQSSEQLVQRRLRRRAVSLVGSYAFLAILSISCHSTKAPTTRRDRGSRERKKRERCADAWADGRRGQRSVKRRVVCCLDLISSVTDQLEPENDAADAARCRLIKLYTNRSWTGKHRASLE